MSARLSIALALALAACEDGSKPADPVWGKQACGDCGMVVSDPRLAAELTTPDGARVFFDDPGCMASYVRSRHLEPSHMWVRSSAETWIDAHARFARGATSPMDYGFVPNENGDASWSDIEAAAITRARESEAK